MLFAFLTATIWAHPFDVNFYGHDLLCRLEEKEIRVTYALEIPSKFLAQEMRQFWAEQSSSIGKEQFREVFIAAQYDILQSEIDILIDEQFVPWDKVDIQEIIRGGLDQVQKECL